MQRDNKRRKLDPSNSEKELTRSVSHEWVNESQQVIFFHDSDENIQANIQRVRAGEGDCIKGDVIIKDGVVTGASPDALWKFSSSEHLFPIGLHLNQELSAVAKEGAELGTVPEDQAVNEDDQSNEVDKEMKKSYESREANDAKQDAKPAKPAELPRGNASQIWIKKIVDDTDDKRQLEDLIAYYKNIVETTNLIELRGVYRENEKRGKHMHNHLLVTLIYVPGGVSDTVREWCENYHAPECVTSRQLLGEYTNGYANALMQLEAPKAAKLFKPINPINPAKPAKQDVKAAAKFPRGKPAAKQELKVPGLCKNLMPPDKYEKQFDAIDGPLREQNKKVRERKCTLRPLFKKKEYNDATYEERKKMREEAAGPEPDDSKVRKMMEELRTAVNAINKVCRENRNIYPLWFNPKKSVYNQCNARMKCVDSSTYRRRWDTLVKLSTEEGKQTYKQEEEKRKALIAKRNASFKERLKQRTDGLGFLARNAGSISVIHVSPPKLNL